MEKKENGRGTSVRADLERYRRLARDLEKAEALAYREKTEDAEIFVETLRKTLGKRQGELLEKLITIYERDYGGRTARDKSAYRNVLAACKKAGLTPDDIRGLIAYWGTANADLRESLRNTGMLERGRAQERMRKMREQIRKQNAEEDDLEGASENEPEFESAEPDVTPEPEETQEETARVYTPPVAQSSGIAPISTNVV